MTAIGLRDTRITIQRPTQSVDSQGSPSQTWVTLAVAWARVQTLTAKEVTNGTARSSSTETLFSIRYQTILSNLNPRDRIVWGTAVYDIASSLFLPQGRPSEILLTGVLVTDIAAIAATGNLSHDGITRTHDGVGVSHTVPTNAVEHDGEAITHDGILQNHNA